MNGINTKINAMLKRLLQQKGQSLTEFALILGFCVAIGWAANEVGFLDAIGAVFESGTKPPQEVAAIGGGTGTSGGTTPTEPTDPTEPTVPTVQPTTAGVGLSGFDWGYLDPNTYFEKPYEDKNVSLDGGKTHVNFETAADSQADRLAADQKALENIARHFIGMTKSDIENLMTGPTAHQKDKNGNYIKDENGNFKYIDFRAGDMCVNNQQELMLGHFVPGENNKGMVFLADGMLGESQAENIFKWMKNPDDPDSVEYSSDYMYLVSDYAVSQNWITGLDAGNNQKNGLRIQFEYDYSDKDAPFDNKNSVKVIGVNIALDPRSQDNDAVGTDYKEGGKIQYNRKSSSGLNVQVRTDSDGTLYVTTNDTGRIYRRVNNKLQVMEYNDEGELVVDANPGKDSMYRWLRDGDDKVVKKYFVDNSTHVNTPDNLAAVVTDKKFEVGDIIQLCNEKTNNDGIVTGYEYKYYVALTSNTFTVSNENINALVNSGDFVQIKTYYHDKQSLNRQLDNNGYFKKISMKKGDLMITDKGEIYMYVGSKQGMSYAGIDDTNYILLNAKNQGTGGGTSDFETRKAEITTWISNNATAIADNSYNNSLTRGDVIKSGDKYYITLNTETYDFRYNNVSVQAGWGKFAEFTNKYYGAADVDASGNLPTLYAGDIVVDSDGTAYVYMDKYNAGNNYVYPLATSYTNLYKLNVQ